MSGVWGWFGGQSAQKKKDSPKNAILGLRSQLEMLQKRERHLQNQMDEQDAIARKNVSSNKNGMFPGDLQDQDLCCVAGGQVFVVFELWMDFADYLIQPQRPP
jgi:hypothetical protein